jgi:hypothetical protein
LKMHGTTKMIKGGKSECSAWFTDRFHEWHPWFKSEKTHMLIQLPVQDDEDIFCTCKQWSNASTKTIGLQIGTTTQILYSQAWPCEHEQKINMSCWQHRIFQVLIFLLRHWLKR